MSWSQRTAAMLAAAFGATSSLTTGAHAQSYNVDFGDERSTPASSYGAAGLPGVWNSLGVPVVGVNYPLVDIEGRPLGVTLNNVGGTELLVADDPATEGNDGLLMDDMLIGFNDPLDVCIWFKNLPNGPYEVLIYAMTPLAPELLSRTRVDFAAQGPVWIGGAWPGGHELGVTYSRHTVTVVNNQIGLHSGLISAQVQSGINGIQIRPLVTGDLTGDAAVNGADLGILLGAWGQPGGVADLNDDGIVDGADAGALLAAWTG